MSRHWLGAIGLTSCPPAESREPLISRLTTPRRVAFALVVIIVVAFGAQVREVAQREGHFYKGGDVPVGADFFVFYSAGRIVAEGDGAQLYDLQRQRLEQAQTLNTDSFDGFLPFSYPAFFAAPYALLSRLPFLWAYGVHTLLLLAATVAAIRIIGSSSATIAAQPLLVALAVFAAQPLIATNFGGLAVAFSLLCFAGAYSALGRGHDATAGIWLGLMLYKPQLALPILLLLLWHRRWRTVGIAGTVGLALAALGVVVAGPEWPRRFVELARGTFSTMEARENGANMMSLLGVAEQFFGIRSGWAYGIAGALSALAFLALLHSWRGAKTSGDQFPLQFGLAIAVTLVVSPHALFYEASLLIMPLIFLVDWWIAKARERGADGLTSNQRSILISIFAFGYLWPIGSLVGFHPFAALPVAVGFLILRALRQGKRPSMPVLTSSQRVPVRWGESPIAPAGKALMTSTSTNPRLEIRTHD